MNMQIFGLSVLEKGREWSQGRRVLIFIAKFQSKYGYNPVVGDKNIAWDETSLCTVSRTFIKTQPHQGYQSSGKEGGVK